MSENGNCPVVCTRETTNREERPSGTVHERLVCIHCGSVIHAATLPTEPLGAYDGYFASVNSVCPATVFRGPPGCFETQKRPVDCGKPGKVPGLRDGKRVMYCATHDPDRREREQAARDALVTLDNRGNPYRVSICKDRPGLERSGKRCSHPCVVIGTTNMQTKSIRGGAIHLTPAMAEDVIAKMRAALKAAT